MENIIKSRRKELGLSQEGLAKKCGVSRQTVNAIGKTINMTHTIFGFQTCKRIAAYSR